MKLFHPTCYQHVEPLARRDSWLYLHIMYHSALIIGMDLMM